MKITQTPFDETGTYKDVNLYTLSSPTGMTVKITNFGGIVTSLSVPGLDGKVGDVMLGFDTLAPYLDNSPYFGALVGRYCNRIARGRFVLDGVDYQLAVNNGLNHLHGGIVGFNKVVWQAEPFENSDEVGLKLSYLSRDGQEGYPGNLQVTVIFSIRHIEHRNQLRLRYEARTDKATPLNLTHHGYFNLKDCGVGDCLGHRLKLEAQRYAPTGEDLIPTGAIEPVKGTPLDFTEEKPLGEGIGEVKGGGYDNTFLINDWDGTLRQAARVVEPESGRLLEVFTTEPTIQLYTSNFLDGSYTGKGSVPYNKHSAFCLEAQHIPDSVNHPQFPSTILRQGQVYRQETIYSFGVFSGSGSL